MKEINIREIKKSPVELISDGWGLVTAGDEKNFNTMTVSWGAIGEIWGKDAAFIFIRPQRYTYEFLEKNDIFTITFYGEEMMDALRICGSKSGRDINKAEVCGLTPVFTDGGVTFEQAEYTLVCRKMASQFIDPAGFEDTSIENNYANKDYHKVYIGEILKVYKK
ncbi:MAG: flavin reductase [Clostridia bacterium]|nr:flavin reductase [Clostridia bacterium]